MPAIGELCFCCRLLQYKWAFHNCRFGSFTRFILAIIANSCINMMYLKNQVPVKI